VVATASITFLLINTADSHVMAAGTISGSAEIYGAIGDRMTFADA
jgi:hypothetical protein